MASRCSGREKPVRAKRIEPKRAVNQVLTGAVRSDEDCGPPKHVRGGMKTLAKRITHLLEVETAERGHCAVYEDELQRIWPIDEENRKAKIEQFANAYGFKLSFYKKGLCAIFEKDSTRKRQ
jgi:hypothetical protein